MGGPGSGPRGPSRSTPPAAERCFRIDLPRLGREDKLVPGSRWLEDIPLSPLRAMGGMFQVEASISDTGDQATFVLLFAYPEPQAEEITVTLHYRRSPLGSGTIAEAFCPACARRCRVLYARAAGLACRSCHGTLYLLQRLGRQARALEQRRRIFAKLGNSDDHQTLPPRPKHMRRTTYTRLLTRAKLLSAIIEDEEEKRVASLTRYLDRLDQQLEALQQRLPAILNGSRFTL